MNASTVQKLNLMNQEFYDSIAADFSDSRGYDWAGWDELLPEVRSLNEISVLDVGCGNGRFLKFLSKHLKGEFDYLGIDFSDKLLEFTKDLQSDRHQFKKLDILEDLDSLNANRYSVVVAFGLAHHIPGYAQRKNFLNLMNSLLVPGGLLVISFWMFHEVVKFQERYLDPKLFGLDETELEKNDFILDWRRDSLTVSKDPQTAAAVIYPRYSHYADENEINELVRIPKLEIVKDFRADGKNGTLNRYLVLRSTIA